MNAVMRVDEQIKNQDFGKGVGRYEFGTAVEGI
jgi:hypothetical protein